MRKLLCLLLIPAIIGCLFGCAGQNKKLVKPANFYYCQQNISFDGSNDVFAAEVRETAEFEDIVSVMNNYLKGPVSHGLYTPFPASTQILSIEEIGTTFSVVFSPQLSRLTGPDLMQACISAAMTLFDMTGAETVIITAEGVQLDGKDSVMLTPDRLVFTDNYPPEASDELE